MHTYTNIFGCSPKGLLSKCMVQLLGCPGAPLTNFNEGGSDRGSFFIPKKSQLQNLSTPKDHYFF